MKRSNETFGGKGNVFGIDSGNNFTGIYLSPNSLNCIH